MMKLRPRGEKVGYLRSDSKQVGNMNVPDSKSEYIANHCKVFFMSTIGEIMSLITLPSALARSWDRSGKG